jgi:type 1 glutamine amidotransferase
MKTALIVSGGWEGHQPQVVAQRIEERLAKLDFKIDRADSLNVFEPPNDLSRYQVIIPNWTMGALTPEATKNLTGAIRDGVGLGGIHGGMGDAIRGNADYEWMVGGHFVGHPHVGDYTVELSGGDHPITRGLPRSFPYRSEEYYLLTDPANNVLAQASYTHEGKTCLMPIAWTKQWGKGRIFYSSLGHDPKEFDEFPVSFDLAIRGISWAAGALS